MTVSRSQADVQGRQRIEDMGLDAAGVAGSRAPDPVSEGTERAAAQAPPAEGAAPRGRPAKATAAFVGGIVALVAGVIGAFGLLGIVPVVLGLLARRELAREPARDGRRQAKLGIVFGAVAIAAGAAWTVVTIVTA